MGHGASVTQKLSGEEYLQFWRERIAQGPEQVGYGGSSMKEVEAQADAFIRAIGPRLFIRRQTPLTLLEFGSGYGRMLKRIREVHPGTELFGVDLCPEAIKKSWKDERTQLRVDWTVPVEWVKTDFEMITTFTVLQHVTDEVMFGEICSELAVSLKKGGKIVLLENVSRPGARHVRDADPEDYMDAFPGVDWKDPGFLEYKGEKHAIMVGDRS